MQLQGLNVRLDKYTELAVYRAVQELMLNVVKHSEATVATVSIMKNPKSISIRVEDNGQGLKYHSPRKKGIGLIAMQNKIRLLNGKMKVSSEPGVGTSVEITIPHVQS